MSEYLMFQLYGPMAAWGDIAVGQYRPSFAHPTKSAVLGLIAAAIGLRRDQENAHQHMASSYGFGVQVKLMGDLLRDYHTIQVPPAKTQKRKIYTTRRSELDVDTLGTVLSSRDYRCDALYLVALWVSSESAPYELPFLARYLNSPVFTLYLGRKSCPMALPLKAQVVSAENLKQAFDKAEFPDMLDDLPKSDHIALYWEKGANSGLASEHIITRRDNPLSRRRWQFSDRQECYTGISPGKEE